MSEYTIKDIREAYNQKKVWEKQFPINYFIIRPISFYITYLAIKITENPAKIAAFGFLLGIIGCFFLALSHLFTVWPGILLIIAYSISDAVDGNVARTTKNVTLFGKYLDGLLGDIVDGSYFFFLGFGYYLTGITAEKTGFLSFSYDTIKILPLLLGFLALIGKLWSKLFENRYHSYRLQINDLSNYDRFDETKVIGKSTLSTRWYFLVFINFDSLNNQLLLLILFNLFKMQIWFMFLFAAYYVAKAIIYFFYYFLKTKTALMNKK
jgi:phosphatidylglycerophosphate synthase